ncbi:MAG: efflux RND transporter periplasmic adaptor subunit [Elusimicrobia bacterium]|nr:efflux RND transporter periplasmic adaptor subunit [Elusimicrobiota bacterium]
MKKKLLLLLPIFAVGAFVLWRVTHPPVFIFAGTVEATEVDLSSRLAAPVLEIGPSEGDPVVRGAVVVRLDGADLRLAAEQAERDYQRGVGLNRNGSLPAEALERLRFRRDDAALRLSWCAIQSPLNGAVLRRYREPGEWVTPGQKILTLANLRDLYAYVYVPASVMEGLKLNQTVTALLPFAEERRLAGKIIHIRNEAEFTPKNVQTRTERERLVFGIKIAFDNQDGLLKPGMSVELTF